MNDMVIFSEAQVYELEVTAMEICPLTVLEPRSLKSGVNRTMLSMQVLWKKVSLSLPASSGS